jgi:alkylhydroperoxidase/carboxymuconolactone decarboxylase family protein YurZ
MDASEFKVKEALDSTGAVDSLTDREKHLIGLAVTVTRGCVACTGGRIEKALESGIEYETVRASIDLAAAVNAGVTLRTAIEGAARHGVDASCSGAECSVGTPD